MLTSLMRGKAAFRVDVPFLSWLNNLECCSRDLSELAERLIPLERQPVADA
jgi:hypothetical protein